LWPHFCPSAVESFVREKWRGDLGLVVVMELKAASKLCK